MEFKPLDEMNQKEIDEAFDLLCEELSEDSKREEELRRFIQRLQLV